MSTTTAHHPAVAGERIESGREQLANVLSAAAGLLVALVWSPLLIASARQSPQPSAVVGASIFSGALVVLYLASTLYHSLPPGPARRASRLLDHSAIFLLIAGTYTPFALGPLGNDGGRWLLLCEWVLAVVGIAFKLAAGIRFRALSNVIYLGMGWLGLFWIGPFVRHVSWPGFLWVLAGGVAYTAGVGFYAAKHRPYAHFVWHLFVFAGSCCHAYAVYRYAW